MKILLALALIAGVCAVQEQPPSGVTLPRVVKDVRPFYTSDAREQRIEGKVLLDVVVRDDGSVGDVTVKQSLDAVYGLDDEAVKAAKQWQFKPAEKNGKPIAYPIVLEMAFTLK